MSAAAKPLYHHPTCPLSRRVRLLCAEKGIITEPIQILPWERKPDLLLLNPAGTLPVLCVDERQLVGVYAICEWLEETHPTPPFLAGDAWARAEVRRLVSWFDEKFFAEVWRLVGEEKLTRQLMAPTKGGGTPDVRRINVGLQNLEAHLGYIGSLLARRTWLAGEQMSLADFTAAAYLSLLDYGGDVAWNSAPHAKDWYTRLKSRPSFRPLLEERLPGLAPTPHYTKVDF